MSARFLCTTCEKAAGDCPCDGPTFRFRRVDHEAALLRAALLRAARELCDALVANGFGRTPGRALPGEFDALREQIAKSERALRTTEQHSPAQQKKED